MTVTSPSHFKTDGRSVSSSWRRAPCGTHELNLNLWSLTATAVFVVGRPDDRTSVI